MNRLLLILALVATAAAGVQSYRLQVERTAHAETKATAVKELAKQERAAREAVKAARDEEHRRTAAAQEIANETQSKLDVARADAGRANAAAAGLRAQLAAFTAAHRGGASQDTGTASPGPAAGTALDLLADMFSRSDDVAGVLAEALDRSREAGTACERIYNAMTAKGN